MLSFLWVLRRINPIDALILCWCLCVAVVKMGQVYGCFQVKHSSVAIKEVFGKYDDVLEPGCHCVPWCFGSRVAGALSLRVKQLDVRCETKTKVCFFHSHAISQLFWCCSPISILVLFSDHNWIFTLVFCVDLYYVKYRCETLIIIGW